MLFVPRIRAWWQDHAEPGYKVVGNLNIPGEIKGCIHLEIALQITFISLGNFKWAFCVH